MLNSKFKWGILGPGRIAKQFAKGISSIDNAEVYAVASQSKERGDLFSSEFNISKRYNSYS